MQYERVYHAACSVPCMNKLVVVGSACDRAENKVECYDIASDSWSTLPDMIRRRDYLACVSQGSSVYAICGLDR